MKQLFLLLTFILSFSGIYAANNNFFGGSVNYKFISSSGNSSVYRIYLELYCTDMTLGVWNAQPEIMIRKDGNNVQRVKLSIVSSLSGEDLTPLCNELKNAPTGDYVRVQKFVYSADVTLNGSSTNWEFIFFGYLSDAYSANIYGPVDNATVYYDSPSESFPPTTDQLYIEATLNNTMGPNSSTFYTSSPVPFYCKGSVSYYGLGPVDDDHDELKFKMVPVKFDQMNERFQTLIGEYLNPTSIPPRYFAPPFSGDRPVQTATDSFHLDPTTGQLTFTPNAANISMVAIETDEYRNGVLVGTTIRQTVFLIDDNCTSMAPDPVITNVKHADYTTDSEGNIYFSACEGLLDTAAFDINVSNPSNSNDSITVTADNLPDAAIMNVENNGSSNPVVHIKWNAIDAQPATYFFYLTFTGNGCPYSTRRNLGYGFTIVPHNVQFTNAATGSCAAFPDGKAWVNPVGETSIDYSYKWVDTNTNTVVRNTNSLVGDTLTGVPPGIYKVYVRNDNGCGKNFFIKVDTTPIPEVQLPNDSTICEGMPIALSSSLPVDPLTTYQWSTGETNCCITARESGNYILTQTNHCGSGTDEVKLDFVKCAYCLFVPNAFTPNGDGKNDGFHIIPTCMIQQYKIQIFNRWGQLVYVGYKLNEDWNGSYGGHEPEQGTYYYVIKATMQDRSQPDVVLKGEVTIVK